MRLLILRTFPCRQSSKLSSSLFSICVFFSNHFIMLLSEAFSAMTNPPPTVSSGVTHQSGGQASSFKLATSWSHALPLTNRVKPKLRMQVQSDGLAVDVFMFLCFLVQSQLKVQQPDIYMRQQQKSLWRSIKPSVSSVNSSNEWTVSLLYSVFIFIVLYI